MLMYILFAVISVGASSPKASTQLPKQQTFTFPRPLQISDDQLIIKDLSTFIHNHSLPSGNRTFWNATLTRPRSGAAASALRLRPWYIDIKNVTLYHMKLIEMMKQCVYSSQDRLKHLTGVLEKYQDDIGFRMGFIFTKLDQLLEDMRRIYTYALKKMDWKRVEENIYFYKHLTKKNIDVTYIVEYMNELHERMMQNLAKYNAYFSTDIVQR